MKYLLDCDPGIDDSMAIILLERSGSSIEGITAVHGNGGVKQNGKNILKLLELLGRFDIDVAYGENQPLRGNRIRASHIHGKDGLGNVIMPEPKLRARKIHAVDLMKEKIYENKDDLTLIATGPLTNIAKLVQKYPESVSYVNELIMMAGAISVPGNITRTAEFNVYADPYAAQKVFDSKFKKKTLITSDASMKVIMTPEILDSETKDYQDDKAISFLRKSSAHYIDVFMKQFVQIGDIKFEGCVMYDPLTVAYALKPDIATRTEKLKVDVELSGRYTRGQTVAELRGGVRKSVAPNLSVCLDADSLKFFEYFFDTILV